MMTSTQARAAAAKLRLITKEVEEIALQLNDTYKTCSCCNSRRYVCWPQKQLRDQVDGAVTRLTTITGTFERRSEDPEFLGTKA